LRGRFDFSITYHQLVVYDEGTVPVPDNDWTMRHIEQGFSWRPGCVTFETLEDVGALKVEVILAEDLEVSSEVTRAIVAPFGVSAAGRHRGALGPFRYPYTNQIHSRSVARSAIGAVLEEVSSEGR
jgi:hypothetical protein